MKRGERMSTSTTPPPMADTLRPSAPCPTAGCSGRLKQDGKALYGPVCRWRGWSPTPQYRR